MKNLQKNTTIAFLLLVSLNFTNCKPDEVNPSSSFYETCCEVPPISECSEGRGVFIPNVFTPNGDGNNDVFMVFGEFNEILSFSVSDEDGNTLITRSNIPPNHPANGWDGTNFDGNVVDGTYYYEVNVVGVNQANKVYAGKVYCRTGINLACIEHEVKCAYGSQFDGEGFNDALASFEECN